MALNHYLSRVLDLFDEKRRRCNKEKQCLQTLLAKLKSREEALNVRLSEHQLDNARKVVIERERKVVLAQRNKALKILRDLDSNKNDARYGAPYFAG